jgi:hypothetical protein
MFMHNYTRMWKIKITMKIIIISIIQYLSLKLNLFIFYIWKKVETKSLNLVSIKEYLDCEYAQEI